MNARHPMDPVDAAWLHMESDDNPMMVTSAMLFDEPLDMERVRHVLDSRLLVFQRFRERVVTPLTSLRRPHWELDPEFDLDAHLHHIALPAPGGDGELADLVGELMSERLDRSRPLWQTHVVDGYHGGGVVITRIHHCVADGIALARVLMSLTDDQAGSSADGETATWRWVAGDARRRGHGPVATAMELAATGFDEVGRTVRDPGHLVSAARKGAGGVAAILRVTLLHPEKPSSLRGELGGRKAPAWSRPVPLDEVKSVGRALEATVNDILITAVTGALRRYMLDHGDDLEGREIHATMPVNLRQLQAEITLGNRFGLVYPALPVGMSGPLHRLRAVKQQMDTLKSTQEAPASIVVLGVLGSTPLAVEHAAIQMFTQRSSAVMTNVPGPRQIHHFAGVPLRRVLVWAPPSGSLAMSVTILSYGGDVTVGVATDVHVIPHPEAIVEAFHEELASLVALTRPRVTAASPRRRRAAQPTARKRGAVVQGAAT